MNTFSTEALGCIYTVHSRYDACFYLHLLFIVRESTSFEFLRTFKGKLSATYGESCRCLHIYEDNSRRKIANAFISSNAYQYSHHNFNVFSVESHITV